MAETFSVKVCSLDVGQGMCTFVEVTDVYGDLVRTLLFDLGSTKNGGANKATVEYIALRISQRKPKAFLDGVFLSHKDADHVNLLEDLLKKIPDVGIGTIRYGGRRIWYTKASGNLIEKLAKRCLDPEKVAGFPVGATSYNPAAESFDPIWSENAVSVYVLAVNTPYGDEKVGTEESKMHSRPEGDQANSKSLVCWLQYGKSGFAISGDATYPSMCYINGILEGRKMSGGRMILLPHHGSRKTTFGLPATAAVISDDARQNVTTFARKMGGQTIIASANTKHSHPSLETIELFAAFSDRKAPWWKDSTLDNGNHYVVAYQDLAMGHGGPATGNYRSFQTAMNVYSTMYMDPNLAVAFSYPPLAAYTVPTPAPIFPAGMNYSYSVRSDGELFFQPSSSGRTNTVSDVLFGESESAPRAAAPAPPSPPPASRVRPALPPAAARPVPRLRILR